MFVFFVMPTEILMQIMLIRKQKDKIVHIKIHCNLTWFTNLFISMNERASFYYTIENTTKDRITYNYWVLKTSRVSSLRVFHTLSIY